jgi:hypothetical protein
VRLCEPWVLICEPWDFSGEYLDSTAIGNSITDIVNATPTKEQRQSVERTKLVAAKSRIAAVDVPMEHQRNLAVGAIRTLKVDRSSEPMVTIVLTSEDRTISGIEKGADSHLGKFHRTI